MAACPKGIHLSPRCRVLPRGPTEPEFTKVREDVARYDLARRDRQDEDDDNLVGLVGSKAVFIGPPAGKPSPVKKTLAYRLCSKSFLRKRTRSSMR
jgi:hypothetical protein